MGNLSVILLLALYLLHPHLHVCRLGVEGTLDIPGLPKKHFIKTGNINIGVVVSMSSYLGGTDHLCTDVLDTPDFVTFPEIVRYAVEDFNKNHPLPKSMKLGFVVLDDCSNQDVAAIQSSTFLPQSNCKQDEVSSASSDVVAVIASERDIGTTAIANVLWTTSVPHLSVFGTTDEHNEGQTHPHVYSLMPPKKFEFQVIFEILKVYSWTYVSIIYGDDNFGDKGFHYLKTLLEDNGFCLAVVQKLSEAMPEEEIVEAAYNLVRNRGNARVVVVLTSEWEGFRLLTTAARLLPEGTLVWILSDWRIKIRFTEQSFIDVLRDSFFIDIRGSYLDDFDEWFMQLTPENTSDPWFHDYWELLFNCSLHYGTCEKDLRLSDANLPPDKFSDFRGYIFDTVFVIANATARVLNSTDCSGKSARDCVTSLRLLRELNSTRQEGVSGWLELDSNANFYGSFDIKQLKHRNETLIGVIVSQFSTRTRRLTHVKSATWSYHTLRPGFAHPESQCSFPCNPHEAHSLLKVPCCWNCEICELNERLKNNGTMCERCPELSWPDPATNRTTCLLIPPTKMAADSEMGALQSASGLLFLIVCGIVFFFFYLYRDWRVIKACSLFLAFIMLSAIALGYICVLTFTAEPTDAMCKISFMMFSLSFIFLYGPLLLRTLWIYRIFEAGKNSMRRPPMTKVWHQVALCFLLFIIQVVVTGIPIMAIPKWSTTAEVCCNRQEVEYTCDIPSPALLALLCCDLLLVIICAMLAFKSRHLPNNFNESSYIYRCVLTNLAMAFCFSPTYWVASRRMLRVQILILILFLNHTVALVFLYFPKMYAVLFVLKGPTDEGYVNLIVRQ